MPSRNLTLSASCVTFLCHLRRLECGQSCSNDVSIRTPLARGDPTPDYKALARSRFQSAPLSRGVTLPALLGTLDDLQLPVSIRTPLARGGFRISFEGDAMPFQSAPL